MSEKDMAAEAATALAAQGARYEAFREAAANQADDDLNFDEGAAVSESENGAWVAAWVWVSNSDAGIEEEQQ